MELKKTYKVFRYQTDVRWVADLRARICAAGKPDWEVSSPPEFQGPAGFWTPEELFVSAVNVCILTTFLTYAQRRELAVQGYESAADGVLEYIDGKYRFTEVTVRPHVRLKSAEDLERARQILDSAHKNCLVSNSISAAVKLFPDLRVGNDAEPAPSAG